MDERKLSEVLAEIANVLQSAQGFAMRQRSLAEKSVETAEALEKGISRAIEALKRLQNESQ